MFETKRGNFTFRENVKSEVIICKNFRFYPCLLSGLFGFRVYLSVIIICCWLRVSAGEGLLLIVRCPWTLLFVVVGDSCLSGVGC